MELELKKLRWHNNELIMLDKTNLRYKNHTNPLITLSIKSKTFYLWGGLQFDKMPLTKYGVIIPKNYDKLTEKLVEMPKNILRFENFFLEKSEKSVKLAYINGVNVQYVFTLTKHGISFHPINDIGLPRTTAKTARISNIDRILYQLEIA